MAEVNGSFDLENPVLITEARKLGSVIDHQMVYKKKDDGRLKARMTVRGDQERGHQAGSWSSPTIGVDLVQTCMVVGLSRGWDHRVYDAPQAFLKAKVDRDVFLKPPARAGVREGYCLRLLKSVYGLGDASRAWFMLLRDKLLAAGLRQSNYHPCIFYSEEALVSVYVDDMSAFGAPGALEKLRVELDKAGIPLSEQGAPDGEGVGRGTFLGMGFVHNCKENTIELDYETKERELVADFERAHGEVQPSVKPMDEGTTLPFVKEEGGHPQYRSMVGSLLFLVNLRHELRVSVRQLCQHAERNQEEHWQAVRQVVGYIKYDLGATTVLRGQDLDAEQRGEDGLPRLVAYSDASWAANWQTRSSVSGWALQLGGCTVAAGCKT